MPALGDFILLIAFVTCAYAIAASVAGASPLHSTRRERDRRLFLAALMIVASAVLVHAFVTGDYSIAYVQRYSDTAQPLAYKIASYWGGLTDDSHVLGLAAVDLRVSGDLHEPRPPSRADSLRRRSSRHGDVLHLPDDHPQEPVLDVLDDAADGRSRLTPLLQNFYMAIHPPSIRRVRVDDHPVCLRHRHSRDRAPRRCLAARCAAGR